MSEPGADPGAELELGAAPSRRRIAPIIVLAVAAVLAGLFWVLAVSRSGTADELGVVDSPLIGRPAPSLRGTTIDGEPFDLARRKGSWVVLNFFQSDCVPCKAEHPELVKFVEQQATFDNGAELYTIAQDIDSEADVRVLRRARRGVAGATRRGRSGVRVVRRLTGARDVHRRPRWRRARSLGGSGGCHHAVATGAAATRSVRGVMSRAASLKRWPGWVLLVLVVAGLLAVGSTRDAGARTPEERVEEISKQLACPVCNGETVYESRNPSSANIRAEIKAQVTTTDATDDEIIAYIVQQFEAKTQLVPKASGFESLVWVLPAGALVCACVGLFFSFRRWRRNVDTVPDDEDRAKVEAALAAEPLTGVDEP